MKDEFGMQGLTIKSKTADYVQADIRVYYQEDIDRIFKNIKQIINDFSESNHNDSEVEKNISRGVKLFKNYMLGELDKIK